MPNDDDIFELIPSEKKKEESSLDPQKSRLDEVMDAVQGAVVPQRTVVTECPQCSSARIEMVRPIMGGARFYICRACKFQMPAGTGRSAVSVPKTVVAAGPFFRSSPRAKMGKNTPTYRRKSKKRRNDGD